MGTESLGRRHLPSRPRKTVGSRKRAERPTGLRQWVFQGFGLDSKTIRPGIRPDRIKVQIPIGFQLETTLFDMKSLFDSGTLSGVPGESMLGAWYRMSGSADGLGFKLCLIGNLFGRKPPFSIPVVQADGAGVLYEVPLVVYDFTKRLDFSDCRTKCLLSYSLGIFPMDSGIKSFVRQGRIRPKWQGNSL